MKHEKSTTVSGENPPEKIKNKMSHTDTHSAAQTKMVEKDT